MSDQNKHKRIVNFLFEIGTMRKLPRIHRQTLLTDDMSDNIATHTYRVAMIGWFLAKLEGADPYKVVVMCMCHDMPEVRSNDHNYIHKKYIKIFESEIRKDQLGDLPFQDLLELSDEYDERQSKEALLAKDADILDQIFLLREYEWQGNKEAQKWLEGRQVVGGKPYSPIDNLKTESAKELAKIIMKNDPSEWWEHVVTPTNR